jgi:hypothetical protein
LTGTISEDSINKNWISDIHTAHENTADTIYGNDIKDIRFHIGTVNNQGEITYLDN